jgi:hypothetical protein
MMAKRSEATPEADPGAGTRPDLQLVRRTCEICGWEALVIDPAGSSHDCDMCRAPTRAAVIIPQVDGLTPDAGKNAYAAALGRLGGLKGGHARAAALSSRQRREIARKAANARWGNTKRRKKE